MSSFVAACFNLFLEPAHQQMLRAWLPFEFWYLHQDMCYRPEFNDLRIVDFIEIRCPITAAADCCMEKETDVLKIIFLQLEGLSHDDAD